MNNKAETAKKGAARVRILGRPVDCLTRDAALGKIMQAWRGKKFFHVVTANAEMIYRSTHDDMLAKVIEEAELVTADGIGVVLASRLLGRPAPERVAGYDLMISCLEQASRQNIPVFFLGARPEVLQKAVAAAVTRFPGLQVAGSRDGYFLPGEEEEVASQVSSRRPGLLLVAMGVPKQEKWISRFGDKLPPCVVMGVGGSFDVLSGKARRAPAWVQKAGLEWLYRIVREPSRLKRAMDLPLFLLAVLAQFLKERR
ncbi:MAG TPA: WecB/TagA/CpsF family glycosyltransferase [Firmicutes bacterium]|jgi:N-acetylglucosaminyldiphosphoundecaprenol N-acetyl-beta-D-mannosaminyltransferase|nr:WecB/TagA/CpsF family glycosyltransferase [Bacillota bacterium]